MCRLQWTQVKLSGAFLEGRPKEQDRHDGSPFSSFFQALEKVLMTDLSGSQDQNKHYLNNLRLTALEDGQENYRLGK